MTDATHPAQAGSLTYTIGGKQYTQGPLKFIQLQQITRLLKDVILIGNPTAVGLTLYLTENGLVEKFLAIILLPEGATLRDKSVDALAEELSYEAGIDDTEVLIQVVEDFFGCNLEPSRSGRVKEAISSLSEKLTAMIPSKRPSASSPVETLPEEKTSSTDTARPTPDPTSILEAERSFLESASSASAPAAKG